MDDPLIIISTAWEFNWAAPEVIASPTRTPIQKGKRRNSKPRVWQQVALAFHDQRSGIRDLGWRNSSLGCSAASAAEHVVDGDGTTAKEDQGEGQGGDCEGKLVSRAVG